MNYADIKRVDVANGSGVRVSLFVSGCPHRCPECFNPEAWDFSYGKTFGRAEEDLIIELLRAPHIRGISLLGGEPLAPENQATVLRLVNRIRRELPDKDIWCYTGYLFESLANGEVGRHSRALLDRLDVLVDGPFLVDRKDPELRFRGSANQRVIMVRESIARDEIILWNDELD